MDTPRITASRPCSAMICTISRAARIAGCAQISEGDVMNAWYCAKECTVRILVGEQFAKARTDAELVG